MRKIAVIFPGVGYNKDKPLLYYSGKLAVKRGYELIHLDFSGLDWSKEKLKDRAFLLESVETCFKKADAALERLGDISADEIVFISKSIGTVVANVYAKNKGLRAKQICFSPLEMIDEYVGAGDVVLFCGDGDPYAEYEKLVSIAKDKNLEMFTVHGGNHSLETGEIISDIENIKNIMIRVNEILTGEE